MMRFVNALLLFLSAAFGLSSIGVVQAQNIPNIGGSSLLGQGLPNVSSASTSNTAGILSYCVKNNYLNGDTASSASSVLSKLTAKSGVQSSSGFSAGQQGNLETGNGGMFSVSGMEDKAKSKLCDMVLQHAQSML